jgi:hypothetical protein
MTLKEGEHDTQYNTGCRPLRSGEAAADAAATARLFMVLVNKAGQ